jgi:UDP-N-acetylmuramate--alanine ligase
MGPAPLGCAMRILAAGPRMWQSGAMPLPLRRDADSRALVLAREALARPGTPFRDLPPRLIVVDVERQSLSLIESETEVATYPVSTASAGVGGEEGSFRTPPGWHRIHDRIGQGAQSGAVFESRVATGDVWGGERRDGDIILTRVLTLEGLEDGVNRGPGRDSLARYIYIHGTNHEDSLGSPESHGCVRMANADVIELFERVAEGDPVVVVDRRGALA